MTPQQIFSLALFLVAVAVPSQSAVLGQAAKTRPVAGKADVLRHVPKKFATLIGVDVDNREVELQLEDEEQSRTWRVNPDAEVKIHGWWGRLEEFTPGDRVWVWFAVDRKKQPNSVLMLADEISEQDIHAVSHTLKSFDPRPGTLLVASAASGERTLRLADGVNAADHVGRQVLIQTSGDTARIVASQQQFESMRRQQQRRLSERWRARGLPGTVVFLHPLSGEMDLMLDHEAIRWGRFLKNGDKVTLASDVPIDALVKHVRPWRERTHLRLVTHSGVDQADLAVGQRVGLRVPEPPAEIQQLEYPTDIGRLEAKDDRIDWFLASIYCPCKIAGDRCTGMFYTLSSCNVNACGMPNQLRRKIGELIDEGRSDEEIWHALQKLRGPQVVKQHLLR